MQEDEFVWSGAQGGGCPKPGGARRGRKAGAGRREGGSARLGGDGRMVRLSPERWVVGQPRARGGRAALARACTAAKALSAPWRRPCSGCSRCWPCALRRRMPTRMPTRSRKTLETPPRWKRWWKRPSRRSLPCPLMRRGSARAALTALRLRWNTRGTAMRPWIKHLGTGAPPRVRETSFLCLQDGRPSRIRLRFAATSSLVAISAATSSRSMRATIPKVSIPQTFTLQVVNGLLVAGTTCGKSTRMVSTKLRSAIRRC